jgi:hypothetical protein
VSLLGLAVAPDTEVISPALLATAEASDGDEPDDGIGDEPGEGVADEPPTDAEDGVPSLDEVISEEAEAITFAATDADMPVDADDPADVDASARDSTWAPRRSSARRGGRVTVPLGRRTIVASVPDRLRGLAVAANVEDPKSPVRVQSVAVGENGEITITLNQRTVAPVEVVWFVVSGPHRT